MSISAKGGWCYLNERGISWAETVLSLFIAFSIFGTLVPALHQMNESLELKRERTAAYETLHEAAKQMQDSGTQAGNRSVNSVVYQWKMEGSLCVTYETYRREAVRLCIEPQ